MSPAAGSRHRRSGGGTSAATAAAISSGIAGCSVSGIVARFRGGRPREAEGRQHLGRIADRERATHAKQRISAREETRLDAQHDGAGDQGRCHSDQRRQPADHGATVAARASDSSGTSESGATPTTRAASAVTRRGTSSAGGASVTAPGEAGGIQARTTIGAKYATFKSVL